MDAAFVQRVSVATNVINICHEYVRCLESASKSDDGESVVQLKIKNQELSKQNQLLHGELNLVKTKVMKMEHELIDTKQKSYHDRMVAREVDAVKMQNNKLQNDVQQALQKVATAQTDAAALYKAQIMEADVSHRTQILKKDEEIEVLKLELYKL